MTYLKLILGAATAIALTACVSEPLPAPDALVETVAEPEMIVDVHKGDFAEIQQFVTPCGVSVWLVSEPSIPILSLEMALRWSLDREKAADALFAAVGKALDQGARTKDLGGDLSTEGMADAIIAAL